LFWPLYINGYFISKNFNFLIIITTMQWRVNVSNNIVESFQNRSFLKFFSMTFLIVQTLMISKCCFAMDLSLQFNWYLNKKNYQMYYHCSPIKFWGMHYMYMYLMPYVTNISVMPWLDQVTFWFEKMMTVFVLTYFPEARDK
jgi:hypothetical protein